MMHGLASHFVYVATVVLVYVRMCIIIFVSAHNTLVFKSKIFYKLSHNCFKLSGINYTVI